MKPILFNTEMVQAIQDGRKTVTRRLLKPHNPVKAKECGYYQGSGLWYDDTFNEGDKDTHIKDYSVSCCWIGTKIYIQKYAQYKVGDILYVRETWFYEEHMHDITAGEPDLPSGRYSFRYEYKAECPDYPVNVGVGADGWRPSIHMPKEAARLFLRVTDVHVKRLQDMTLDDFLSEGIVLRPEAFNDPDNAYYQAKDQYAALWNSTCKKSDLAKYGWSANPWVFVTSFQAISKQEAYNGGC